MYKYVTLCMCLTTYAAEKEIPKPFIRPKPIIIYPPTTPAELLARQIILDKAFRDPKGAHIVVKDVHPKDVK